MITFSIIQKSQLESAMRMDAEYFQPEFLELMKKLANKNSLTLKNLAKNIICGPFGSAILNEDYQESGVPLARVADLNDFFINSDKVTFIGEELADKLKRYQVTENDLVVSQRGTIAMFSKITNVYPKWNISANLISIKKSEAIDFNYLLAFLNSSYGIRQLLRKLSGQVQPKITTDDIKEILVFVPEKEAQKKIGNLVQEAWNKKESSKKYYQQAESLLLGELGLKDFIQEENLSTVVNLSDVQSANRMDAEYFQGKYEKVEEAIKKNGYKKLEKIIQNIPAKFDASKRPEESFKYVELSNIDSSTGIINGFSEVLGREAPGRAKRVLQVGDVIASSVEGSLEKVALVENEQEGYLASTGFFQFRSKEILLEVILILAKSIVFQMQLEKQCAGTILTAVPKEAVKNIVVPILHKETQQKIAEFIQKSHTARKKAKFLLDEAKHKVEDLIENQ